MIMKAVLELIFKPSSSFFPLTATDEIDFFLNCEKGDGAK
jgi:hypothetical protein